MRKKYVFNIDLEDFFGAINFGRVRGFFISDKSFNLDPNVATVVAQIACHNGGLPQGSPSSPIISNLIGNILDLKLLKLAGKTGCMYTRYADDITFSTSKKFFPSDVAYENSGSDWIIGEKLEKIIKKTGFSVNHKKTRMSFVRSRQLVTGLTVNSKVNVNQHYYRQVRAMCHSLFYREEYRFLDNGASVSTNSIGKLEGMLSYIYFVKHRRDRSLAYNQELEKKGEFNRSKSVVNLYRKLLCFKYFAAPSKPLIVTEGHTDVVYLRCAIKSLHASFPNLFDSANNRRTVSFLNLNADKRFILELSPGSSMLAKIIGNYKKWLSSYIYQSKTNPVILVCDNDEGLKPVTAAAKKFGVAIDKTTTSPFYYLGENLYVVKIPESGVSGDIEELFPKPVLDTKIGGKPFDSNKAHGDENSYGKHIFAEKVVVPAASTIDFSAFRPLLQRLCDCIENYSMRP